jgi:hypothetical protein
MTLNMIAAELKRLDKSIQGLYMAAIWWHMKKHEFVQQCVRRVAQNTGYEQIMVQDWVLMIFI